MNNIMRRKIELTDAEEAAIQAQIAADSDAPEATDAELSQAKSFGNSFPDVMESIRRSRGRPAVANPRKQISKFKSTGKGWQSRVNEALRKAAGL